MTTASTATALARAYRRRLTQRRLLRSLRFVVAFASVALVAAAALGRPLALYAASGLAFAALAAIVAIAAGQRQTDRFIAHAEAWRRRYGVHE